MNNECAAGYELTTPEDGIETCTLIPKPTSPPTPSPEEENDEDDAKKEAEKAGPHKGKFFVSHATSLKDLSEVSDESSESNSAKEEL